MVSCRFGWTLILLAALTGSAFSDAQTPAGDPARAPAAIPFRFRRGHILLPGRVNGSPPLSFVLDTGYGVTTISPQHADSLRLSRVGQMTIDGIAGEETAAVFAGATFDFAGARYAPRRVAALPSDRDSRARYRDGVLGAGFFRTFVVEIDSRNRTVRLQSPQGFHYSGSGDTIPLILRKSVPVVEAEIVLPGQPPVKALFEIDTGCDSGLCLGHDFVAANRLLSSEPLTRNETREGVGGEVPTRAGHVPRLRLGNLEVENPAANFFLKGSPADPGLAGHIGLEVLRQFKVVFDYARERMILEPFHRPMIADQPPPPK